MTDDLERQRSEHMSQLIRSEARRGLVESGPQPTWSSPGPSESTLSDINAAGTGRDTRSGMPTGTPNEGLLREWERQQGHFHNFNDDLRAQFQEVRLERFRRRGH